MDDELRRLEQMDDVDEASRRIAGIRQKVHEVSKAINQRKRDRDREHRQAQEGSLLPELQAMTHLPRGKDGIEAWGSLHGLSFSRANQIVTKERRRRQEEERRRNRNEMDRWDEAESQAWDEVQARWDEPIYKNEKALQEVKERTKQILDAEDSL